MELLIPAEIPWVKEAAESQGVRVVSHFVPDYIKQVWEERDKYWTKDQMEAREERKRKLKEIGYE
jgi:hypothetical protein